MIRPSLDEYVIGTTRNTGGSSVTLSAGVRPTLSKSTPARQRRWLWTSEEIPPALHWWHWDSGVLKVAGCSPKQQTGLDHKHWHPVQEGPELPPPAEETEVCRSVQYPAKDLVRLCCSICSLLRSCLLGRWMYWQRQKENRQTRGSALSWDVPWTL